MNLANFVRVFLGVVVVVPTDVAAAAVGAAVVGTGESHLRRRWLDGHWDGDLVSAAGFAVGLDGY